MARELKDEFEYYLENQPELGERYKGKYIVVKNGRVIGAYDDQIEAVEATLKEHELGTFLVQKADPDPASTMQTFHSRACFV